MNSPHIFGNAWPGGKTAVLLTIFLAAASPLCAQVVPAGDQGGFKITAGTTASGYYLQYGEQKLLGIAGYVDADTMHRMGFEGEARWLIYHYHPDDNDNVSTTTYLSGPRYHMDYGRFEPYLKGMIGIGDFNFPYHLVHGGSYYLVLAPGGGIDYHIAPRIRIRAVDCEYQIWPQFNYGLGNVTMSSFGISTGFSIRVF